MIGRDTMGMLEQVYHELTLIKGRNNLLERTVEQANEWRDKANRLEEQNRILQKSLRTSKNRVEQLTQELDNSKQREDKLTSSLKEFEERQTQRSGTSWYYQVMALCIILLREHRASEQLKEQLQLMNELVEKLEAEHAAEYKRRLGEISKQMADDMSANIALAHKQVPKKRGQYFFRTKYSAKFISYRSTTVGYKEEQQSEVSTPWQSIYITSFCAFLQAVQFTIFLSSMWPYFRKLNPNVQETEFGVVTAWYSFGTMMSAIIFGYWSNQIKQVRLPLLICFLLMMLGNLIYAALQFAPPILVGHVMMTSRLITGCGIGKAALKH
ncbi:hypothetical protein ANCDUO_10247 [Ancylostoma duodenale]|uniref:Major facilitator superfamily (MFS) profile domain-containing protein n=1 Tax=Ancylostoma duodenale TaxID=51022 RepID=A0A0C2GEA4_9BILA|nr:hypothetical protein ANCDUO_10247 [Ancylostoma duodenale]